MPGLFAPEVDQLDSTLWNRRVVVMASGLPFLKFFVKDYLADERLFFCSLAAQGLWMRMLCFMHENVRRGYLDGGDGIPLTLDQLARFAGVSKAEISPLIQELITSGVASATAQGTIFNRRMIREEALRNARAEAGRKGGNQRVKNAQDFAQAKRQAKSKQTLDSVCVDSELFSFSSDGENAPLEGVMRFRFVKPTAEEVKAYCTERNNQVDAEEFVAFYEARGWKLKDGNKMCSWRHAVITWEKYQKNGPKNGSSSKNGGQFSTLKEWAADKDLNERHPGDRR